MSCVVYLLPLMNYLLPCIFYWAVIVYVWHRTLVSSVQYNDLISVQFSSIQSLSRVWLVVIPWTAACQASPSITNSQSVLRLMSIKSVMPSNHLILCRPPLLLPSIFPSISAFSNESVLRIRWPKDWSFSFSNSPSNEYTGLISFRIDGFDFFALQETLKSLLQHRGSKASILQCSAFFMVQLSQSYVTTGKTIAWIRQTLVGKVMSLLFNTWSRFVIAFLPRSKHLLISRLQSPSAVILEPKKTKYVTVSIVSPSICREVIRTRCHDLSFWMVSFKPGFSLSSFTVIKRLYLYILENDHFSKSSKHPSPDTYSFLMLRI